MKCAQRKWTNKVIDYNLIGFFIFLLMMYRTLSICLYSLKKKTFIDIHVYKSHILNFNLCGIGELKQMSI